jgi:hypothetical protein
MQLIAPHPDVRVSIEHDYTSKAVLTRSEASLFFCLDQLSQGRCRILCKPRIADFIQHPKERGAFNKISQKHVDFLICRQEDWVPMFGVELDDPSHESNKAKQNDMFKNRLFAHVGIPLVRIHVTEMTQVEQMVEKLTVAWLRRSETLLLPPAPKPKTNISRWKRW